MTQRKGHCLLIFYSYLITSTYTYYLSSVVTETKVTFARRKIKELPLKEDIHKLFTFLRRNSQQLFTELKVTFSCMVWKELLGVVLIMVQIFNRRRPGKIERLLIEDYNKKHRVNEDVDLSVYNMLSETEKEAALKYSRIQIRGKLGRIVPVILYDEIICKLKFLLSKRKEADVPDTNPYVFGIPNKGNRMRTLDACVFIQKFSEQCGAKKPHLLRGTHLRKHIATHSIALQVGEQDREDLAQFMGHHEKIHRGHYRMSLAAREITGVTKFLVSAMGCDGESDDEDTSDLLQDSTLSNDVLAQSSDSGNSLNNSSPSVLGILFKYFLLIFYTYFY